MSAGNCFACGKVVYFAERADDEGKVWHQICLSKHQKETGGIHNKGWYGTTPQDASIVAQINKDNQYYEQIGGNCTQCQKPVQKGGKFCSFCGAKQ